MARRLQIRRVLALALLLGAAFVGLGYRLVHLQVFRHEELRDAVELQVQRQFLFEPRRGDILDCRGNLLAASAPVKMICADPALIGSHIVPVARVLAPLLEMSEADLVRELTPRLVKSSSGEWVTNQFVRLKQRVPIETWEQIRKAMAGLYPGVNEKKLKSTERLLLTALRTKAVFAREQQVREYPNGSLAAHVLGYTSPRELEVNDQLSSELIGMEGVERAFNKQLSGARGWRVTQFSGGYELAGARNSDVSPEDGLHVVLTIDSVIQHIVEAAIQEAAEKLAPTSICAMVVRPRTGEILAMATVPTFDPNKPGDFSEASRRNRIITDVHEPGSTFKLVPVSGVLNEKLFRLTDMIDCENGNFSYGGRILHDHVDHGLLSLAEVIGKSSNIGAAKVGLKLGQERLYDYVKRFGFGAQTGIPLPGEAPGRVHALSNWSKISVVQIPMGHGIDGTRLQMVMAMCAIANEGWLMRPMLVHRLEDSQRRVVATYAPQRVRQVISPEAARQMTEALKQAVTLEGTAAKAALELYSVAGKTGTANKVENKHYVDKYFSSFIGFFPADRPEICIGVSIDEPPRRQHFGGQVAAPIFKQIAERAANYLNIRPEEGKESPAAPPVAGPAPVRPLDQASARTLNPPQKGRQP